MMTLPLPAPLDAPLAALAAFVDSCLALSVSAAFFLACAFARLTWPLEGESAMCVAGGACVGAAGRFVPFCSCGKTWRIPGAERARHSAKFTEQVKGPMNLWSLRSGSLMAVSRAFWKSCPWFMSLLCFSRIANS